MGLGTIVVSTSACFLPRVLPEPTASMRNAVWRPPAPSVCNVHTCACGDTPGVSLTTYKSLAESTESPCGLLIAEACVTSVPVWQGGEVLPGGQVKPPVLKSPV